MTWHVDADLLEGYTAGQISDVAAWSLEAHLEGCVVCRSRLDDLAVSDLEAAGVDDARMAMLWSGVSGAVRAAARSPTERVLVRFGMPDHDARLVAATPSLTRSWLLGVVLVLALGVSAAWTIGSEPTGAPFLFLLLAPLVPVAGVGIAFGPRVDPTYELGVVAPMQSSRLLLLRAIAVLSTSSVLATAAALALPVVGWPAAAWILPSLGLTAAVLAASARWHPLSAAATIGIAWVALVVTLEIRASGALVAFGAAGQSVMLVLFLLSAAAFATTRERVDPAARS